MLAIKIIKADTDAKLEALVNAYIEANHSRFNRIMRVQYFPKEPGVMLIVDKKSAEDNRSKKSFLNKMFG